MTKGKKIIVVCINDFNLKIRKHKICVFKKRQLYNAILYEGQYSVYGEFIFHGSSELFNKYFKKFADGEITKGITERNRITKSIQK